MQTLPPGQKEIKDFPRFGLPQYADRFPKEIKKISLSIGGEFESIDISDEQITLPRVDQVSDFHCVTTWSKLDLNWSGFRFKDFYDSIVVPRATDDITFVVLKAQDGYKTSLPLEDLLQANVLLADRLNDQPLSIEHGAPLRIVAPDHYGYKNLKHLKKIEFYSKTQVIKQGYLAFMDHPRARVANEERAANGPGRFFRWLYKFGIKRTIKAFKRETALHKELLSQKR